MANHPVRVNVFGGLGLTANAARSPTAVCAELRSRKSPFINEDHYLIAVGQMLFDRVDGLRSEATGHFLTGHVYYLLDR